MDVTEILEGEISKIRVTIPLLLSDGEHKAEVKIEETGFTVEYLGHVYRVQLIGNGASIGRLNIVAPNRNAEYDIGYFESEGKIIRYRLSLNA